MDRTFALSLRDRILIILLFVLCCYAGLELVVLRRVIQPELMRQEETQGKQNLQRSTDALDAHLKKLHRDLTAAARSGQFYPLSETASSDQLDSLASDLGIDVILLYDNQWNRVSRQFGNSEPTHVEQLIFDSNHPFVNKDIPGYSQKGIVNAEDKLLYVMSAAITRSAGSQTVEGTVVAGRYITPQLLQLQLNFEWDFLDSNGLVGQNREIVNRINHADAFDLIPLGDEYLQVSTVLYDHQNRPALLLKIFQDRSISRQSLHTMVIALYAKIGIGIIAALLLTWLLQRLVVNPIMELIKHIVNVGDPNKRKDALAMTRKDEIGALANEFDQMCQRLESAQVKLMEKSYLSGVTEMSSGILHNVRNALSPITTRIERIKGQFKTIPLDNLEQAQLELQKGALSPDRRHDLMRFVDLTFQDVLSNLKDMVTGLDDLANQVFEIEDMLNLQRTFSRQDRHVEFVTPADLLNRALEMVPEQHREQCRITIDPKIKKISAIPVEPTTFVQILQNLLINAAESLEKQQPLYRKINIQAQEDTVDEHRMLHWQIRDNGIGIAEEKLQKIFERGASSKNRGLTGIGLHWCANTITAMKGRIWAESHGDNKGATFHILIPMAPETETASNVSGDET